MKYRAVIKFFLGMGLGLTLQITDFSQISAAEASSDDTTIEQQMEKNHEEDEKEPDIIDDEVN